MFRHFRILRNRTYSAYFFSQMLSMVGTWMQSMVQAWLVYRLSLSGSWLGLISFCNQVPAFFMAPIAGVFADQKDRKQLLLLVQILSAVQALALAILVFTDTIQLWHIAMLAAFLGILSAFDITIRHSFAIDLVGRNDLSSAIVLNSFIIGSSRILGPALGGMLIGLIGEGWCFIFNTASYIPVVIVLLMMKVPKKNPLSSTQSFLANPLGSILESLRYVQNRPIIFLLLLIATFVGIFGHPYTVLLPVISHEFFSGTSSTFAWLSAMNGLGALLGGLTSLSAGSIDKVFRNILLKVSVLGMGLILLSQIHFLPLSCLVVFAVGFCMMSIFPTINNAIQHAVDDQIRGRVLSLYTMSFLGAMPIGALMVGTLSDQFGTAKIPLIGCGIFCFFFGAGFLFKQWLGKKRSGATIDSGNRAQADGQTGKPA